LAFSLKSFGSTICPRSSTLIKDSTLQQLELFPLPAKQLVFSFLFMAFPPPRHPPLQVAGILFLVFLFFIFLINQIILISIIIQIMFVKRFFVLVRKFL